MTIKNLRKHYPVLLLTNADNEILYESTKMQGFEFDYIPAINGYIKSSGDVKIIAGATLNGAMLVTRKGLIINEVKELAGHIIAVPQFGNTQHLYLLNLLSANGLSTIE